MSGLRGAGLQERGHAAGLPEGAFQRIGETGGETQRIDKGREDCKVAHTRVASVGARRFGSLADKGKTLGIGLSRRGGAIAFETDLRKL